MLKFTKAIIVFGQNFFVPSRFTQKNSKIFSARVTPAFNLTQPYGLPGQQMIETCVSLTNLCNNNVFEVHQTCVLYTYTSLFILWSKLLKISARPGFEPGTFSQQLSVLTSVKPSIR